MTYTEIKKLKSDMLTILIFVAIGIALFAARFILVPMAEGNISDAEEMTRLDQQVSSAKKQLGDLQYAVEASNKLFVNLSTNKDAYIKAIGMLCDANKLNIHKMTVNDVLFDDGSQIAMLPVQLELQGDLYNVRGFLHDLNDSEILCRVSSISYRLANESFSWMWREIDKEDAVGWWDLSDVQDYLLEDPDVAVDENDVDLLDASAFMQHSSALCYIEVQFIGVGA